MLYNPSMAQPRTTKTLYVMARNHVGRSVGSCTIRTLSKDEVFELLRKAEAANLRKRKSKGAKNGA